MTPPEARTTRGFALLAPKRAHHQALFAPVELEGLTQIKLQRHERLDLLTNIRAPGPDEVNDTGVTPSCPQALICSKKARVVRRQDPAAVQLKLGGS